MGLHRLLLALPFLFGDRFEGVLGALDTFADRQCPQAGAKLGSM